MEAVLGDVVEEGGGEGPDKHALPGITLRSSKVRVHEIKIGCTSGISLSRKEKGVRR